MVVKKKMLARGTVKSVVRRPWKIPRLVRAAFVMAPTGWWKRKPFLPLPDKDYWRFRLETSAGGEGDVPPSPDELLEVVDWAHRMKQQQR